MYGPVLELSKIIQTINKEKGQLIPTHHLQHGTYNDIGYTPPTLAHWQ